MTSYVAGASQNTRWMAPAPRSASAASANWFNELSGHMALYWAAIQGYRCMSISFLIGAFSVEGAEPSQCTCFCQVAGPVEPPQPVQGVEGDRGAPGLELRPVLAHRAGGPSALCAGVELFLELQLRREVVDGCRLRKQLRGAPAADTASLWHRGRSTALSSMSTMPLTAPSG